MGLGGWWDAHVVPRVLRCGCGSEHVMDIRRAVVPLAAGAVFELGCGGGFNQRLYDPARVTSMAGIDPCAPLLEHTRREAAGRGWAADIREARGEDIPFEDGRFDCVVCTFTLCSVDDHARVLAELRRILKPGGQLFYAEHGRAPDAGVARMQAFVEPAWKRLFGNCHLTRPVSSAIAAAGFATAPLERRYMRPGPRFAGWMEWGVARKPD